MTEMNQHLAIQRNCLYDLSLVHHLHVVLEGLARLTHEWAESVEQFHVHSYLPWHAATDAQVTQSVSPGYAPQEKNERGVLYGLYQVRRTNAWYAEVTIRPEAHLLVVFVRHALAR
jgi:hypothetical protein